VIQGDLPRGLEEGETRELQKKKKVKCRRNRKILPGGFLHTSIREGGNVAKRNLWREKGTGKGDGKQGPGEVGVLVSVMWGEPGGGTKGGFHI